MSEAVLNGHSSPTPVSYVHNQVKGRRSQSSIRKTLSQALQLKDLTFQTALELRDQFVSSEAADLARARAQALTGLVKSWSDAVNVIRIERGKPLPGSLRPEPKPRKVKKQQQGPAFTEE